MTYDVECLHGHNELACPQCGPIARARFKSQAHQVAEKVPAHEGAMAMVVKHSPDLLEALQALVKAVEQADNSEDMGVSAVADEMIAARVAIRKALGQE